MFFAIFLSTSSQTLNLFSSPSIAKSTISFSKLVESADSLWKLKLYSTLQYFLTKRFCFSRIKSTALRYFSKINEPSSTHSFTRGNRRNIIFPSRNNEATERITYITTIYQTSPLSLQNYEYVSFLSKTKEKNIFFEVFASISRNCLKTLVDERKFSNKLTFFK